MATVNLRVRALAWISHSNVLAAGRCPRRWRPSSQCLPPHPRQPADVASVPAALDQAAAWGSRLPAGRFDSVATSSYIVAMNEVGIKTLKNRLSEYVRAVSAGQTVLVTDRGRVVAELIAPRVRDDASEEDQRLGELMRQGVMSPPKAVPGSRLPTHRPLATLEEVLRDLADSRAER